MDCQKYKEHEGEIFRAFNTCENQELNLFKGTEINMIINENAVPVRLQ